ncbi:MAG: hypothetical protein ABIW46_09615 [Acidimicrobiales bacterium]
MIGRREESGGESIGRPAVRFGHGLGVDGQREPGIGVPESALGRANVDPLDNQGRG